MTEGNHFRFEELHSPQVESFVKANQRFCNEGLVKIWPPGCTMSSEYRKHVETIRKLKVLPDDVWVVTYPKCGTTWTQEMVWLLANNVDFETAKKVKLTERSSFMELSRFISEKDRAVMKMGDTVQRVESMKSPRCIKSHLPLDLLPEQLWTVNPKIVYVARNPKDVAVSYYHHHRSSFGYTGTCEEFLHAFLDGNILYGSIWDHILPFWEIRNRSNVLFNTYEEMKKDLPGVVQRTAQFLQCDINKDQIKQLCEHLSFESMKKNPMTNYEEFTHKYDIDLVGKLEPFMRKGQVGSWKNEIGPELAEKVDKWSMERLKNTDYSMHIHE